MTKVLACFLTSVVAWLLVFLAASEFVVAVLPCMLPDFSNSLDKYNFIVIDKK